MLDKSIPYVRIVMRREPGLSVPAPALPAGYAWRMYRPGDGARWAELEAAVLEFPDEAAALRGFGEEFGGMDAELEKRCVLILDGAGRPAATATAWFTGPERTPMLHWVSVHPRAQGLGLGRAVTERALALFETLDPERAVLLHTQTWSAPAVRLYASLGFRILADADTPRALEILRGRLGDAAAAELERTAIAGGGPAE